MDDIWSAGAQVIGTGIDAWSQSRANAQNKDIWKKTQDWQTYMSNTQYQRAAADMRAAGINPILLASKGMSGASTPSGGGTPSLQSLSGGKAVSSALDARRLAADIDLIGEQAKTQVTQQNLNNTSAAKIKQDIDTNYLAPVKAAGKDFLQNVVEYVGSSAKKALDYHKSYMNSFDR